MRRLIEPAFGLVWTLTLALFALAAWRCSGKPHGVEMMPEPDAGTPLVCELP